MPMLRNLCKSHFLAFVTQLNQYLASEFWRKIKFCGGSLKIGIGQYYFAFIAIFDPQKKKITQ